MLLGEPRRDEPADDAHVALGSEVRRGAVALLGEDLLLEVGGGPSPRSRRPPRRAEALPGDVLLELLVLHRAAELLLGHGADDVRAGFVADPRVHGHVEVTALAPALGGLRLVGLGLLVDRTSAAGGEGQRGDGGYCPSRAPRLRAVLICGSPHLMVDRKSLGVSGVDRVRSRRPSGRRGSRSAAACGRPAAGRPRRRGVRRPPPG